MKVKVTYQAFLSKEVEVDDKFSSAIPAWKNGDDDTYTKLVEELHDVLKANVLGDICEVSDEQDNVIYEL